MKLSVKKIVLDQRKIMKATERMERRALFRTGGYFRTIARRKLGRKASKRRPSVAGEPPKRQFGGLRDSIRFAVQARSVVIGPTKRYKKKRTRKKGRRLRVVSAAPKSEIHEFGGIESVRNDETNTTFKRVYPARPYMKPTLVDGSKGWMKKIGKDLPKMFNPVTGQSIG